MASGPLASGLLLAVAFPPLHLVLPAFVALVPLGVHLEGSARGRTGGGASPSGGPGSGDGEVARAFRAGAVAGGVAWALLLAWMPPALVHWSWMAVPGYGLAVAALAAVTGLAAVVIRRLRGAGVPLALALPLGWTAGEWLRAHLPGPLAFPWLGLGTSLTGHPEWVGIAEVVGERGVTFWLAGVSGLLATAWVRRRGGRSALPWLAAAGAAAVAVPAWGVVRAGRLDAGPVARVAVVQPSVARSVREDPAAWREAVWTTMGGLAGRVLEARPELVVLPEGLLPDTLDGPRGRGAVARLAAFSGRVGAPLLVGGLSAEGAGRRKVVHNSVFLVDSTGLAPYRYDKHHLVPLVERLPLLPLPGTGPGLAGYAPGVAWTVAEVEPSLRVGAFVCYESAFADVTRGLAASGARLLVNVTNDAWFGGPAPESRTHALWQHPAHLVMRAVETRRGIARAANTGFSFFVDPVGRIRGTTALFEPAVTVATVRSAEGTTPFVRWGDVAGTLSVAVALVVLLAGALRSRHLGSRAG